MPLNVCAQDTLTKAFNKKGVFSFGIKSSVIMSSYEGFDVMNTGAAIEKVNFGSVSSYDRNGNRSREIRNFAIGVSAMYRVINRRENSWGVEVGYTRSNVAFKYNNLNRYSFPVARNSPILSAWVNWYSVSKYSVNIQRAWSKRNETKNNAKWFWKFGVDYLHLHSFNKERGSYQTEWINSENEGAVWNGDFLRRGGISLTPEIGRQILVSEKSKVLFQFSLAYQLGLINMYKLNYEYFRFGDRWSVNTITVKGDNLAINLALHIPIRTSAITKKTSKSKERIEKLKPQFSRNNLVFLLDVSSSMNANGKLNLLKTYMIRMLDSLPTDDYLTIVTFSGATKIVLEPTLVEDKDKIIKQILSIKPHGSTNINKGLATAYDVFKEKYIDYGNNRIVIATDGDFKVNEKTKEKVEVNLGTKNIKLSVFHFVSDKKAIPLPVLKELATLGGGNYALIDTDNINLKLREEYQQKLD